MDARRIKITIVDECESLVSFRIVEQTHRNRNLRADGGERWKASNGVSIASIYNPEINVTSMTLYVRGKEQRKDDVILDVDRGFFNKIVDALREYNGGVEPVVCTREDIENGDISNYLERIGVKYW